MSETTLTHPIQSFINILLRRSVGHHSIHTDNVNNIPQLNLERTCSKLYSNTGCANKQRAYKDVTKKHCRCRRSTRRVTNTKYRKMVERFTIADWPSRTLNLLKIITIAAIKYAVSLPVSGLLLQHIYLAPFPRYYHFSSVGDCLRPWEVLHLWE